MLTERQITELEAKGFKRWQKGNMDRMYINAKDIGLVCTYYNTGNISTAKILGASGENWISNSEARRMKASKTFVDVKTGELVSDNRNMRERAEELLAEVIGEEE